MIYKITLLIAAGAFAFSALSIANDYASLEQYDVKEQFQQEDILKKDEQITVIQLSEDDPRSQVPENIIGQLTPVSNTFKGDA